MQACTQCNYNNADDAVFCNRCGVHLQGVQSPLEDRRIGKYQLKEKIGGGGFGVVYKAQHVELNSFFAIKVLHPHLLENALMVERFRREAVLLANLKHDSIVRVSDFGQLDGLGFYIVMEWLPGHTFQAFLKEEGTPSKEMLVQFFGQLLDALGYAHREGIVHRDLKPENLMLMTKSNGQRILKILDFGIACMVEDKDNTSRLTETGLAVGTPRYMSPEQAAGAVNDVDHRSDLYACGVLLVELLTGKQLFSGTTNEILIKQIEMPAPRLQDLAPHIHFSPSIEAVVSRALAKHPADRFQSAQEFADSLFPLLQLDETRVINSNYQAQYESISKRRTPPVPAGRLQSIQVHHPETQIGSQLVAERTNPQFTGNPSAITRAFTPAQSQVLFSSDPSLISAQILQTPDPAALSIEKHQSQSVKRKEPKRLKRIGWLGFTGLVVGAAMFSGLAFMLVQFILTDPSEILPQPKAQTKLSTQLTAGEGLPPLQAETHKRFPKENSEVTLPLIETRIGEKKEKPVEPPIKRRVKVQRKPKVNVPSRPKPRKVEKRKVRFQKKPTRRKRKTAPAYRPKKAPVRKVVAKPKKQKPIYYTLKLLTIPSQAKIFVNGIFKGKSPLRLRIKSGSKAKIFIKKERFFNKQIFWRAKQNQRKSIRLAENIFQ